MLPSLVVSTDVVGSSLVLGAVVSAAPVEVKISVDPVVFSSAKVVATKILILTKYALLSENKELSDYIY